MVAVIRKTFLAFVLGLVMFTTSAWQPGEVVSAQSQAGSTPETPLYRGLTWSSLGPETGDIRVNVAGETISLAGERYQAAERFPARLPEGVLNYYSNGQLAKAGWASYDAFDSSDGAHYVFYHEASGVYLSVEFLHCPDASAGAPAERGSTDRAGIRAAPRPRRPAVSPARRRPTPCYGRWSRPRW